MAPSVDELLLTTFHYRIATAKHVANWRVRACRKAASLRCWPTTATRPTCTLADIAGGIERLPPGERL